MALQYTTVWCPCANKPKDSGYPVLRILIFIFWEITLPEYASLIHIVGKSEKKKREQRRKKNVVEGVVSVHYFSQAWRRFRIARTGKVGKGSRPSLISKLTREVY